MVCNSISECSILAKFKINGGEVDAGHGTVHEEQDESKEEQDESKEEGDGDEDEDHQVHQRH